MRLKDLRRRAPRAPRSSGIALVLARGFLARGFLAAGFLAAGCGQVHLGDHDAGPVGEDGSEPVVCGDVVCGAGEVCCNPSCNLCAQPGFGCPPVECVDECSSDAQCGEGEYCRWPDGACGPGQPGVPTGECRPVPAACPGIEDPVCGCDGQTYGNPCLAEWESVSIAHAGRCGEPRECEAQDARGEGGCAAIVGVAWDGAQCRTLSGCGCAGADCGAIFDDVVACETAFAGCASCAPQDATGVGACFLVLGTRWNGTSCEQIGGCECAGADCDSLYGESCEVAHAHCNRTECVSNETCGAAGYCHYELGACAFDGVGECRDRPETPAACTFEDDPICGCDGVTYACAEMAHAAGVSVLYDAPCASAGACAPDDSRGVGECALVLGVRWNGRECESLSGCSCVGDDCGRYTSFTDCEREHAGCEHAPGGACGGIAEQLCRPDEWCEFDEVPGSCGGDDSLGTCRPRPATCDDDVLPVCGCDGTWYQNVCVAQQAGQDDRTDTRVCGTPPPSP